MQHGLAFQRARKVVGNNYQRTDSLGETIHSIPELWVRSVYSLTVGKMFPLNLSAENMGPFFWLQKSNTTSLAETQ